ncbi:OmpA family protein [Neptunicella sp.]|uniref:OmpA family protein n=1 Tax=Neptunicella sp. TaxID=2125986 RepID=UPI003F690534
MNINKIIKPALFISASIFITACTTVPARFAGADAARERLNALESNTKLADQAPMAMEDARQAVLSAEQSHKEPGLSEHLVFIAERKVDIAETESQRRYLEEQRSELKTKRDNMQLNARTEESRRAKISANQAQQNALQAQERAAKSQQDTAKAQQDLNTAEEKTAKTQQQLKDMQQQLAELNAHNTLRGAVVTLGDLLFDFNKSEIKPGAISHLTKLASFLNQNTDRNVTIEGHTDNVGADDVNQLLSQQRAEAVKNYLLSQGVAEQRLQALGKGSLLPVTDNSTALKRQQNRRVEVIISNPVT